MVHDDWALACVRDNLAAWNRRNWSVFKSLHTRRVVYESPHSRVVGRKAVVRKFQELVALVPDLHASDLRMIRNDREGHRATFAYVQTGTLADAAAPNGEERGPIGIFLVQTTMDVRFDDRGRMVALRTVHS